MQDNFYEILGVEETATESEIKSAYRNLAKKHHPDKGGDENVFKKISTAYEVLGDPQKRSQYDNQKNNPFAGMGGGFEDMFSQMFGSNPFGGGNPFGGQRRQSAPSKTVKVEITPIESYLGSEKNVIYIKDTQCQTCGGSGGEQQHCNICKGSGFQLKVMGTGFMVQHVRTVCDGCGGRGYKIVKKCNPCNGNGTNPTTQDVRIKIPVGIDSGQYLKLQGYGDFVNGTYGDLLLQIEVVPKDGYEKMNNDLIYNLYLDFSGIKKEYYLIPHPSGDLNMAAPKMFDTSKPLRLKGKGYNGGDMYVKLNVKFDRESITK
jgi:molecular chaperone DnaJ